MMLILPEVVWSPRKKRIDAPAPPAPPMLVAASLADGVVTLAFDRAIDVADFSPNQVLVDDGTLHARLGGGGSPTMISTTTVAIEMESLEPFGGAGVTLNAGPENGIVATIGGAAWAGATDLALPFGA